MRLCDSALMGWRMVADDSRVRVPSQGVRRVINKRIAASAPEAFRTLPPEFAGQIQTADYGCIHFVGRVAKRLPRFIHLAATREPYRVEQSYLRQVS